MTTVAPVPGREAGPCGEGDDAAGDRLVAVAGTTTGAATTRVVSVNTSHNLPSPTKHVPVGSTIPDPDGSATTVDLTIHAPRVAANDPAGQASWVLGLALALLSEGAAERVAMAEVLAEAAGRSRAIEGAYGRAVALLSEYPGDPLVHRTVDLLAKALLRSRRPARAD